MDSGSVFGLEASFDKIKSVSKLLPEIGEKLNTPNKKPPEVLEDFAARVNKQNEMTLKMASQNYEVGGNLDLYA
jgi:hypothetical protein